MLEKVIHTRVSKEDYLKLLELSKKENRKIADIIRIIIKKELDR